MDDLSTIPVDHDPWAPDAPSPRFIPVDHDPWAGAKTAIEHQRRWGMPSATEQLPGIASNTAASLVAPFLIGPHLMADVASGRVDPNSPDSILRTNAAVIGTMGGAAFGAQRGAVGAFGGMAPVEGLYSKLGRTVDAAPQAKASADQWLGMLRNAGVKPDEMQWMGVGDWLRQQKGAVTKDQLADYIRGHQVDVHEVVKGEPPPPEAIAALHRAQTNLDSFGEQLMQRGLPAGHDVREYPYAGAWSVFNPRGAIIAQGGSRADAIVNAVGSGEFGSAADRSGLMELMAEHDAARRVVEGQPTKFGEYQLPGGENYREMLLTLPPKSNKFDVVPHPSGRGFALRGPDSELLRFSPKSPVEMWPAREHAEAAAVDPQVTGALRTDNVYKSSHFDEPNILAHVRFNDRTIDGKKTLFIEEVQSDWHQAGRNRGYSRDWTPEQQARVSALIRERDEMPDLPMRAPYTPEQQAQLERHRAIGDELAQLYDQRTEEVSGEGRVPDAPFKTTWPELAMKRMTRYAAENGYDKIAWTTGETQAARYDLSRQIDRIDYAKSSDGTHAQIDAVKDGGHVFSRRVPINEIDDFVGKEVGDRIRADKGELDHTTGYKALSGLDLKVGGEGMKGFYDQILPSTTNKLAGKYGAKVGTSSIEIPGGEGRWRYEGPTPSLDRIRRLAGRADALTEDQLRNIAEAVAADVPFDKAVEKHGSYHAAEWLGGKLIPVPKNEPVHSLDLTPKLKDTALKHGFPLFAIGGGLMAVPVNHDPFEK